MNKQISHVFWLIILSICWASLFLFVKVGVTNIDPITLMAGRGLTSLIFMFIVLLVLKKPILKYLFNAKFQIVCFIAAILTAYMWYSIAKSETVLSAAFASFLLTALVPFSWIIATFITREKKFYIVNAIGILIATFGILVLLGFQNVFKGDISFRYGLLYISGLATFAMAAAVSKKKPSGSDVFSFLLYNLFYLTIIFVVLDIFIGQPFQSNYTFASVSSMIGTGIVCSGISYLIFFWLVADAGQVFASLNTYLVPIFGLIMSMILLNEHFYLREVIALGIIFVGIFFANKTQQKVSS